jgi:hypothetical protein
MYLLLKHAPYNMLSVVQLSAVMPNVVAPLLGSSADLILIDFRKFRLLLFVFVIEIVECTGREQIVVSL